MHERITPRLNEFQMRGGFGIALGAQILPEGHAPPALVQPIQTGTDTGVPLQQLRPQVARKVGEGRLVAG